MIFSVVKDCEVIYY